MEDKLKLIFGIFLLFLSYIILGWIIPYYFYVSLSETFTKPLYNISRIQLFLLTVFIWHFICVLSALLLQDKKIDNHIKETFRG